MKIRLCIKSVLGVLLLWGIIVGIPTVSFASGDSSTVDHKDINPHPRLLMSDMRLEALKNSIEASWELQQMHNYVISKSDDMLKQAPVRYEKNGKRLLAVSRLALTRIFFLSYSYRLTEDQEYLHRAEQELLAVSNFDDWNPSHFLDVGEMSMAVAIGYDWLYEDLNKSTLRKIRKAIVEKAFVPSENDQYSWFYGSTSNWNQVCNAGLVMAALAIYEEDPARSKKIIDKAIATNVKALKNYGPDGNYPEGPGYWSYGTSYQVMMLAGLEGVLGTDFGLSQAEGFLASAEYMLFSTGPSGQYFNYSDCISKPYPSYPMFWFANKLQKPHLIHQEIQLIKNGEYFHYRHGNDDRLLPSALIFSVGIDMKEATDMKMEKKLWTGNGETPVAYFRTSWENDNAKYLGVKGGYAAVSHGHMDQGAFVYDIGELRWAMDFGSQQYESLENTGVDLWDMSQYGQRWEVFRLNNLNHNTLSINNQPHNVNGKASIVKTYDEEDALGVQLDLTEVLNIRNEIERATREIKLIDESILTIEDHVTTGTEGVWLRWNMVTPASVKILDEHIIELSQEDKTLRLVFSGSVPFSLEIRPSEDPSQVVCEFTKKHYGDYNDSNPGTSMLGFNAYIPKSTEAKFRVEMGEENIK